MASKDIPYDSPEFKFNGYKLKYDPYQHQIRKPDGTILKNMKPGYSPSDLKKWAEQAALDDQTKKLLIDFADRCTEYSQKMTHWGTDRSRKIRH